MYSGIVNKTRYNDPGKLMKQTTFTRLNYFFYLLLLLFLRTKVFKPSWVSNYSLEYMQSPVLHTSDNYKQGFLRMTLGCLQVKGHYIVRLYV